MFLTFTSWIVSLCIVYIGKGGKEILKWTVYFQRITQALNYYKQEED